MSTQNVTAPAVGVQRHCSPEHWRREPPDCTGWWWRMAPGGSYGVAYVEERDGKLGVMQEGQWFRCEYIPGGWWSGPLTPPPATGPRPLPIA